MLISGGRTSTKILDFALTPETVKITQCFGIPEGSKVLRIKRLRLADGSPFSYIINYVPSDIGQQIRPSDLTSKPLLKILEDDLHIKLVDAIQKIEATIANTYVSQLLEIRVGDPLLKIERIVFSEHRRAVEYVKVLYRADRYYYTARLERKKLGSTVHSVIANEFL